MNRFLPKQIDGVHCTGPSRSVLGTKPTFKPILYDSRRSIEIDRLPIPKYHFNSTCSQTMKVDLFQVKIRTDLYRRTIKMSTI